MKDILVIFYYTWIHGIHGVVLLNVDCVNADKTSQFAGINWYS